MSLNASQTARLSWDLVAVSGSQFAAGSASIINLTYNFGLGTNDNGNVYGITNNKDTTRSQTFTYDNVNRITKAQAGSRWGVTFTYDAWGNLYQTGSVSGTSLQPMSVNQAMDGANRFTLLGYTYDGAGNTLSDGVNSGCSGYAYSWNADELMTCGNGSTYVYNGDGARVKKSGGSSTSTMYWGGQEGAALTESDLSGTVTSEYVFLNGKRIARRDVSTSTVYYYFLDMLGSSSVLTNASGTVVNESDFAPYGAEIVITQGLSNQHYKFTGKERDSESGLDYFGARYFANISGRFMSPDWSASPSAVPYAMFENPQTLNLYLYVKDNPESLVDADGHAYAGAFEGNHPNICGDGSAQVCNDASVTQVKVLANSNEKAQSKMASGARPAPAGGPFSAIKRWYTWATSGKEVLDAKAQYDHWRFLHQYDVKRRTLNMSNSKDSDPEHVQVDQALVELDEAEMAYYVVTGHLSVADATDKTSAPFLGEVLKMQLQMRIEDAIQNLKVQVDSYNAFRHAVVVENPN